MKHYKFPDCDCQFEVLSEDPLRLKFEPDISKIPLDCRRTWNLLSTSKVKGCFQLESKLGQSFTKKLQPQNIEQLSALIALIRPSCLETIIDKKSITQHYIDRKHNIEPIEYFHPSLEPILKDTYGLLAFQEGSMKIAQEIAGFNLQESDTLRKSIGHKDTVLMAKLKDQFINGCIKVGKVNQTEAEEIFSWIEKAQRYQFNASIIPTTKVLVKSGEEKTIAEVEIGDEIKCPDGYTTITNKFDHGKQEVFKITLESGKTITCTMAHKFLCDDGIIRPLREILEKNMKIMCSNGV